MSAKDSDRSAKTAASPAVEYLSDAELDTVIGAGDPIPYPDIDGGDGGNSKVRIGKNVSGSTTGSDEAGTLNGLNGPGSGSTGTTTLGAMDAKVEGKSIVSGKLNEGNHN